jgi:hypothetical protein
MKEKSFKALTPERCKLQLTLTHWPKGRCSLELKKHGKDGKIKRSHNSKNNDTLLQTFCTQTECIMLSVNENKCRYVDSHQSECFYPWCPVTLSVTSFSDVTLSPWACTIKLFAAVIYGFS